MKEWVLSWEGDVINSDTSFDKDFAEAMESVKSLLDFVQCVSTYCIVSDQEAEVKESS